MKQLFFAFANRHVAYQYKSVIGLTTFATEAKRWCHATENLGTFQHHIDMTEANGRTALLDALALATEELTALGAKYVAGTCAWAWSLGAPCSTSPDTHL